VLKRVKLHGAANPSVIVKQMTLPDYNSPNAHPKGWDTPRSHSRKLKSYQVESNWYQNYASRCDSKHKVPSCLSCVTEGQEVLFIIEDLAAVGYPKVLADSSETAIYSGLDWLASFHARFMDIHPNGLWDKGTYWHLETRPDELSALKDLSLKQAAKDIDRLLSESKYQTLVHGDAKLANFCFSEDEKKAAAVDFQYVGKGVGVKDVALFLSSVLSFEESVETVSRYVDHYFEMLTSELHHYHPTLNAADVVQVWRLLYPVAWADFQRFVKGWSPDHWKINPFTEALTEQALVSLPALKLRLLKD
jgi:thiamine kinase-like enzyme